jgi:hypothetical protein
MRLSSDAVTRRFEVKERERMGAEWAVAGGLVSAARIGEGEENVPGKEEMRAPVSASKRET